MKGVIGIGNPFKGDDGIGLKLLEEIEKKDIPEDVRTYDMGSETFDLIHVLKDLDKAIIIDAVQFGGSPGDYRFFTPDEVNSLKKSDTPHGTDILEVLSLSEKLDEMPEKILIMGVQPKDTDLGEGFSRPLESNVPELVEKLYEKIMDFFSP